MTSHDLHLLVLPTDHPAAEGAVFKLTSSVFEASMNLAIVADLQITTTTSVMSYKKQIVHDGDRVAIGLVGIGLTNGSKNEGLNSFRTGDEPDRST